MADVDMPDASSSGPVKGKVPTKVLKAGGTDSVTDGKKRFEVKKVPGPHKYFTLRRNKR